MYLNLITWFNRHFPSEIETKGLLNQRFFICFENIPTSFYKIVQHLTLLIKAKLFQSANIQINLLLYLYPIYQNHLIP